jgi:predicted Ser/Thr protein kinase
MKLIRSVELQAPLQWTDDQAQVGRGEILEFKGSQANFDYDTYPPLAQAVENKLLNDSKELFSTILNPDVAKNKEESHREQDLLKALKEDGHCDTCARDAVYRAWNFIKEH